MRVLQEREFERIGDSTDKGQRAHHHRDEQESGDPLQEGKFREDLYYRLNVFPILVPPLRDRKTDIMLLADHFVQKYSAQHDKKIVRISTAATDMLMAYHWPGNVRELENCIERAIILTTDGVIQANHLPPNLQTKEEAGQDKPPGTFKGIIASMERELIAEGAMRRTPGEYGEGGARAWGLKRTDRGA